VVLQVNTVGLNESKKMDWMYYEVEGVRLQKKTKT